MKKEIKPPNGQDITFFSPFLTNLFSPFFSFYFYYLISDRSNRLIVLSVFLSFINIAEKILKRKFQFFFFFKWAVTRTENIDRDRKTFFLLTGKDEIFIISCRD